MPPLHAVVKGVPACSQAAIAAASGQKRGCAGTVRPVAVDEPCRVRLVGKRDGVKAVHPVTATGRHGRARLRRTIRPARRCGTTCCGSSRSRTRPGFTPSRGRSRVRSSALPPVGRNAGVSCSRIGAGCSLVATVTAATRHHSLPAGGAPKRTPGHHGRPAIGVMGVFRVDTYRQGHCQSEPDEFSELRLK